MNTLPNIPTPERLDTLRDSKETAAYLGINYFTLARWRSEGKGPAFVRVGRQIRYREGDLIAWLSGGAA